MLPAATWYEKHDLNTTDMHPFVHAFNPAIAPPWETRTDFDAFATIARGVQPAGRDAPRRPHGPGGAAAAARHPRRAGQPARAWCGTGRPASATRCPGRRCRSSSSRSGTTRPSREKWAALGPLVEKLGLTTKGVTDHAGQGGRVPAAQERRDARTASRRRPAGAGPGRALVRGDPGAVGDDERAAGDPGLPPAPRSAPACGWPTWPPSTRAS